VPEGETLGRQAGNVNEGESRLSDRERRTAGEWPACGLGWWRRCTTQFPCQPRRC
jgi:hypothetical protein